MADEESTYVKPLYTGPFKMYVTCCPPKLMIGVIGVADYVITPKNPANYAITPTADYAITQKHRGNYAITPK